MSSDGRISFRVGGELAEQIEAFRTESGIDTTSSAARTLLQLGLEKALQLDAVWRRIARQEGVIKGQQELKNAYNEALARIRDARTG